MTNRVTVTKAACLTAVLATTVALTVATSKASAKGRHDNNDEGRKTPQFAINGPPVNVKGSLHDKKNGKHGERKKKKNCQHVTVPTPECGVGAHDPVRTHSSRRPDRKHRLRHKGAVSGLHDGDAVQRRKQLSHI